MSRAHEWERKERTRDVKIANLPFANMFFHQDVKRGLASSGFVYPTAVQAEVIPYGKSSLDLIIQGKSGTGKTLIYATMLLESVCYHKTNALVVVPTREIAIQVKDVLNSIGKYCSQFRAVSVIGGTSVIEDRRRLYGAKAIIGTIGRILHLMHNKVINCNNIKLLILDEADKLFTNTFKSDLHKMLKLLPKHRTIACSATFDENIDKTIFSIMDKALFIGADNKTSALIGINQFVYEIPEEPTTSIAKMQSKYKALKQILCKVSYKQCLIFTRSHNRADSICNYLLKDGMQCALMTGALNQTDRTKIFEKFRNSELRMVIATDVLSRGIDSESLNLVINLDLPLDIVIYFHRIGRAGRFGSYGTAINIIFTGKESKEFEDLFSGVGSRMCLYNFPYKAEDDKVFDFASKSIDCSQYVFGSHETPANKQSELLNNEKIDGKNENQVGNDLNESIDVEQVEKSNDSNKTTICCAKESLDNVNVDEEKKVDENAMIEAFNGNENILHEFANISIDAEESKKKSISNGVSNNSINDKTYEVNAKNLLDVNVDDNEELPLKKIKLQNSPAAESHQSSSLILPSSNTIDDASSLTADSVRSSSQANITKYQKVVNDEIDIAALKSLLIDKPVENSDEPKPIINLIKDYCQEVLGVPIDSEEQNEENLNISATKELDTEINKKNKRNLATDLDDSFDSDDEEKIGASKVNSCNKVDKDANEMNKNEESDTTTENNNSEQDNSDSDEKTATSYKANLVANKKKCENKKRLPKLKLKKNRNLIKQESTHSTDETSKDANKSTKHYPSPNIDKMLLNNDYKEHIETSSLQNDMTSSVNTSRKVNLSEESTKPENTTNNSTNDNDSTPPPSSKISQTEAEKRWMEMYWKQVGDIQQYVEVYKTTNKNAFKSRNPNKK